MERLAPKETTLALRNFLGRFGLAGDSEDRPVASFSGGEKSRLALALLAWQKPHLLLLDEPTNHLDLDMRDALTIALEEYTGAVVIVSHDRSLIRAVADELWLVADGEAKLFDGDLEDYKSWIETRRPREAAAQPQPEKPRPAERAQAQPQGAAIETEQARNRAGRGADRTRRHRPATRRSRHLCQSRPRESEPAECASMHGWPRKWRSWKKAGWSWRWRRKKRADFRGCDPTKPRAATGYSRVETLISQEYSNQLRASRSAHPRTFIVLSGDRHGSFTGHQCQFHSCQYQQYQQRQSARSGC